MNKVVQHIWNEIRALNTAALTPVFDKENPIRSSYDIRTWWTSKPCEKFDKTHINFVVCDSKWEYLEAKTINESDVVKSFVKNDHLNFVIFYNYQGVVRRFFPDFIIKLNSGENLIVETKGQDNEQNKTKRAYLDEWCRAINQHGGFGKWSWAVSLNPNDLENILIKESRNKKLTYLNLISEMNPELITALISAGMQAIDLWLNFKDRFKAKEAFQQIPFIQNTTENKSEATNLMNLIPEVLLDTFSNRVKNCFDNYYNVLNNNEYLPQEIDEATEAVKRCVCRELKRLYSVNGSIPDGILMKYWLQYNCKLAN